MPGCSLCMGSHTQVREAAILLSTRTRSLPNRLAKSTKVFLAGTEYPAMASKLVHIPTVALYHEAMTKGPRCDPQVVFMDRLGQIGI